MIVLRFFISILLILTGIFSSTAAYSQERILDVFDFQGDSLKLVICKIDYELEIVSSQIEERLWEEDSIDVEFEEDEAVFNENGIRVEKYPDSYLVEDDSLLRLYQIQMIGEKSFDIHLCGHNYEVYLIKGSKVVETLSIILNCGRVSTSWGEFDMDMQDLRYLVEGSIFRKNRVKTYSISYENEDMKTLFTQAVEHSNNIIFTDASKGYFIDVESEIQKLLDAMK